MKKCEWCGRKYDMKEADYFFSNEIFGLSYDNIKKNLCGECAVQVIEDEVDGIYFERCEECGKEFDLIEESGKFSSNFSYANGTCLRDYWNPTIICCDCALKRV